MKPATFDILLENPSLLDPSHLGSEIKAAFQDLREDLLQAAKAFEGNRQDLSPNPSLEAIQSCSRIQVMATRTGTGLQVQISAEDLAVLFGGSPSGLYLLLENTLQGILPGGSKAAIDQQSPGFALIGALHRASNDNGRQVANQGLKRRFAGFALFLIIPMLLFLLPLLGIWHLKNEAEAKLAEITTVALDLKSLVESQGKKLESLYKAGADLVDWSSVKDKVSDLWAADSSEAVR